MISEKEIGYTNNITIEMKIRSTMHLLWLQRKTMSSYLKNYYNFLLYYNFQWFSGAIAKEKFRNMPVSVYFLSSSMIASPISSQ